MKTVLLMPCHQGAQFLPEVLHYLDQLDPQPDLYVFSENNSTDGTLELIRQFSRPKRILRLWFRDGRGGDQTPFDRIAVVRECLLQAARQADADFAIFLDSDIRVRSQDLVYRLTRWGGRADIVGGPCMTVIGGKPSVVALWPGMIIYDKPPSRTLVLEDVMVVGGACMCLRRRVIEDRRLRFYPVTRESLLLENALVKIESRGRGFVGEDSAYCMDAWYHGYSVCLDWTVVLDQRLDGHARPWDLPDSANVRQSLGVDTWLVGVDTLEGNISSHTSRPSTRCPGQADTCFGSAGDLG